MVRQVSEQFDSWLEDNDFYDSVMTPYYFEVKIFPYYTDIRLYEVLDKPTKKLHFDAKSGTFKDDGEYFRQYQLAYENCENAVYNFSERINKIAPNRNFVLFIHSLS